MTKINLASLVQHIEVSDVIVNIIDNSNAPISIEVTADKETKENPTEITIRITDIHD